MTFSPKCVKMGAGEKAAFIGKCLHTGHKGLGVKINADMNFQSSAVLQLHIVIKLLG